MTLVEELRAAAFPLAGTDPRGDLSDLSPLDAIVGAARIVSVCEASHGAREIYQLKHRVIRRLVEQHGFESVAITCSHADALPLTQYTLGHDVDPRIALCQLRWWTLDTEEVLEMA